MPLIDVKLDWSGTKVPADVRAFLREAERRIEEFQHSCRVPAFVPSDFQRTYNVLRSLSEASLTSGNLFCEWGSGFGVVACLAAMLDFDAIGIEIEEELVAEAQKLADDFGLPVEFMCGSFIPKGGEVDIDLGSGFAWLSTDESDSSDELGLDADDFDVIFAYPWPDEEWVAESLFERFAGEQAVLVSYHGSDDFRVRRKKATKRTLRAKPRPRR